MFESVASSRVGMKVAVGIGRAVPRRVADPFVRTAARRIALNRDSRLVRAARLNQWMISGRTLAGEALDAAVLENLTMAARFLYDLYHVLGRPAAEDALIVRDEAFERLVERERSAEGPFVYVGVHFGNFDIMGRALGRAGWRMQTLSVPEPTSGYQWQNEMREQVGFRLTPVSVESLKEAARRLEQGESVLTGLDRPLPRPDKVMPRFFGHPAPLPLLHVRLAMRAGVPVVVCTSLREQDGRYRLLASDPIPMEGTRPTPEALLANAERCLAVPEAWIREHPAQWVMPHIVWPDLPIPG